MRSNSKRKYLGRKRNKSAIKNDYRNLNIKDENKLLNYVIKLSEEEYRDSSRIKNDNKKKVKNMNELKSSPFKKADEIDFLEFSKFVDSLWDHKSDFGVLKIKPPELFTNSIKSTYISKIDKILEDIKIIIRKQELSELYKAENFEYIKDYTLSEYLKHENELKEKVFNNRNDIKIEEIENKYWELCQPDNNEKIHTLYAADIELLKLFGKIEIKKHMFPFYLPNYWSLLNSCFLPDSLLQFSQKDGEDILLSGINVPWIYYGILFSTFCWHVEDLNMYSINYLHSGAPKIWYSIAPKDKEKFTNYCKNKYSLKSLKSDYFSYSLFIHINPLEIIEAGIEVTRTIQYPGELIVTLPQSYHMGFSTGINKAEAVNYTVIF